MAAGWAGHIACQDGHFVLGADIERRHGRKQGLGVRVPGIGVNVPVGGRFDDLTQIHHGHVIADVLDDGQVVRDEDVGKRKLLLQVDQQVDDLGLDRDIEGRHRFVADDELRAERERPGDADALPLSPGELVGVAAGLLGGEADLFQEEGDPLGPFPGVPLAVDFQGSLTMRWTVMRGFREE